MVNNEAEFCVLILRACGRLIGACLTVKGADDS